MQALLAKPSVRLKSCSAVIYKHDKGIVKECCVQPISAKPFSNRTSIELISLASLFLGGPIGKYLLEECGWH